jgi:phage tail sheath protein FI
MRYSLPSSTQGGSWGAFYYPFITVRDLGKNINVPPAAYVSNNYIAKYENALPWSIVAGVRRGVIGGSGVVGLEINLDQEDREYLEPFGLNPIVFQSGTGPTIFANKTAQQTPRSALSSINVREVVIYIQDGIDAILKNYLFEFNTAQTRLEIKTLADNFLSTVQNDDGVYDFRNVMDESNNTPEVIDQNIGILDTYIEPVRGMEILVQRTTILRTGAISTGNFQ